MQRTAAPNEVRMCYFLVAAVLWVTDFEPPIHARHSSSCNPHEGRFLHKSLGLSFKGALMPCKSALLLPSWGAPMWARIGLALGTL